MFKTKTATYSLSPSCCIQPCSLSFEISNCDIFPAIPVEVTWFLLVLLPIWKNYTSHKVFINEVELDMSSHGHSAIVKKLKRGVFWSWYVWRGWQDVGLCTLSTLNRWWCHGNPRISLSAHSFFHTSLVWVSWVEKKRFSTWCVFLGRVGEVNVSITIKWHSAERVKLLIQFHNVFLFAILFPFFKFNGQRYWNLGGKMCIKNARVHWAVNYNMAIQGRKTNYVS